MAQCPNCWQDLADCTCAVEGGGGGVEDCNHNWVSSGTGTMLDPRTGKPRTVQHYKCAKCATSKSEWA